MPLGTALYHCWIVEK